MEIAALGLRIDGVQNADRAAASLDNLSRSGERAERTTGEMGRTSGRSSREVRSLADASRRASTDFASLGRTLTKLTGIAAGAFASFRLTGLIKDAALANSRFEQLEIVAARVGQNVQMSAEQVRKYSQEVQGMGISMTESRQTVIRMIQAQMDLSKASELARLAQDAAVIANTNSSDALGRLIYGLQSGQVEILRNMGLNVNFAASYTQLAAEMGKTVNQLTEADRVQARTNAVMAAGAQIAGTYEASMDSASKQLGSTTRYVQDLQVMIGGLFSDAARQSVFGYSDALKGLHTRFTALTEDGTIERWSKNVATAMNMVAGLTAGLASYIIAANGFTIAAKAAAAAQWLFNAAAMANPYILAASALVALGVALYGARDRTIELGDTTATIGDYMGATWDKLTISASGYADAVGSAFKDSMPAVVNFAEGVGSLATAVGDAWLYVMRTVANIVIGTTESVGRTVGILAKSIYNAFKNSFQTVLNLGSAFRSDLVAILSGDFSFSGFREELKKGFVDPTVSVVEEIKDVWTKNLSYDWIGGATQAIKDFGAAIGEAAEASYLMRTVREELNKKAAATKRLAAEVLGLSGATGELNNELGKYNSTLDAQSASRFRSRLEEEVAAAQRSADVSVAGVGMGDRQRQVFEEQARIAEEFARRRTELTQNQLNEDRRMSDHHYNASLEALAEAEQARLNLVSETSERILEEQSSWANGARRSLENYVDSVRDIAGSIESAVTGAFHGMEDALVSFVSTGKADFKSLANSIIQDMIRIAIQQSITGPLASMFSFGGAAAAVPVVANAKGGVYDSPSLSAYSGGVYNSPKMFAFAKGAGVFGEAGPEAIMPLSRGPGGVLGVRADTSRVGAAPQSGDVNITVNVTESGANTRTEGKGESAAFGRQLSQAVRRTVQDEITKAQLQGGRLWQQR